MAQCKICGTGEAQHKLKGQLARICEVCLKKCVDKREVEGCECCKREREE